MMKDKKVNVELTEFELTLLHAIFGTDNVSYFRSKYPDEMIELGKKIALIYYKC